MKPTEYLMDDDFLKDAILHAESFRGVYIPQFFAESINDDWLSESDSKLVEELLEGPENENYWEIWDSVLDITITNPKTKQEYSLYQDGDLWLVPNN